MKRANENATAKSKKLKSSDAGQEMGTIVSVCLQNFMCHDNLQFDFDPRINFIIGQNGSGKSAILTGIILALGGKASVTGRYSNIKGFVKTNKNKARVSVTLKNCGPYSYKPELYGEKITIEREINLEGNSAYKLKGGDGRIVSTSKEELNNVLIAMDIQIDNPVVVLTQETSRNFLMSKKEDKLYEFFYRGTGLKRLEEEYTKAVEMNLDAEEDLISKMKALKVVEKEVEQLRKLKESDAKLDELKREQFWARVNCLEKELNEQTDKMNELVNSINNTKQEILKQQNKYDTTCDQLEKCAKECSETKSKINVERKALEDLIHQQETIRENVGDIEGKIKRFKREEKKLLEDIHHQEESIREHQMKDQADYEKEKKENEEKIAQYEAAIISSETKKKELGVQRGNLQSKQVLLQLEIKELNSEINDLKQKIRIHDQEYNHLSNASKNRQLMFGQYTPQVLADIQKSRDKFIEIPKGPIGLDIEVKDKKWKNAVEACLKPNILRSFCCDNARDSTVLTQILQKYYADRMPSITISPFLSNVHDVSQHRAQTNFPTVLDMLKIKDPVIANCLIDNLSIENIILIEDITIAQNVMLDNPPVNCYSAFLENCDEILLNPYRYYSATMKATNMLSQTVDAKYLQEIKEEIWKLNEEVAKKETEKKDVDSSSKHHDQKTKEIEREILSLESEIISKNKRSIEELQQLKEPPNVPEMFEEYESLKANLKEKQEELEEFQQTFATEKTKYKELSEKVNRQKEVVNTLGSKSSSLGASVTHHSKNKEIFKNTIESFERKLKSDEKEFPNLEKDIQTREDSIQKLIEKRKRVDDLPRMHTNRDYKEIKIQLEEMKKVICEKSNTTDKASLFAKYDEKNEKLIKDKRSLKQIEKENEKVKQMMEKRRKRLHTLIQHTQRMLESNFIVNLSLNDYSGSIIFQEQRLKLEVSPKPEHSSTGVRSGSLSGGERSFVTISFLLALWDRIKMPFRILDEYDVFMDSNNRYLSINILLKRTETMKNVQFIFLSPLDLPEMLETENVKVHKMPAPQRIGLTNMEED